MNWIKLLGVALILVVACNPMAGLAHELAIYEISQHCAQKYPEEVQLFERRNGIRFKDAVETEARNKKASFSVSAAQVSGFCVEMMGRDYSVITFSSKPTGAKVFVDGDEQPGVTDKRFRFPPGTYKYEIKPAKGEACGGSIEIKKGKKYKLSCPH